MAENIPMLYQLLAITPEITLLFSLLGVLCIEAGSTRSASESRVPHYSAAVFGVLVALLALVLKDQSGEVGTLFYGQVVVDSFSQHLKILLLVAIIPLLFLFYVSKEIGMHLKGETLSLVLCVLLGAFTLASTNDFMMLFIGIELMSLPSYVLSAMKKSHAKSNEAGLKYVLYGALSSGFMLFGLSGVYGLVGTLQFPLIAQGISQLGGVGIPFLWVSLIMFFAGIGFKIACFPFHMWSPDVYEGSPLPVTAFFSLIPKLGILVPLVRLSDVFLSVPETRIFWSDFLAFVGVLTMFVGNISAINQKSVKRMLAYSSVAHSGVLLTAVLLGAAGAPIVLFYGASYIFMTLVVFLILSPVVDVFGDDSFDRFDGFLYRHPFLSVLLMLSLFSLTGIPPFVGFVAKYQVISGLIARHYHFVAFMVVLNSVISAYYYFSLVRGMVFRTEEDKRPLISGMGLTYPVVVSLCCVPIFVWGLCWSGLYSFSQQGVPLQ